MIISRGIELIFLVAAAAGIVCIVLAAFYDLRAIAERERLRTVMRQLTKRRQPHVTVLITHATSTAELARCLESIRQNQYHSMDIVAIADHSLNASERRMIRQTVKAEATAGLYAPRKYAGDRLLRTAYRRSERGDVVLLIDANETIEQSSIKRAVGQLKLHSAADGVRLAKRIDDITSLSALIGAFFSLGQQLLAKALTTAGSYRVDTHTAGLYKRSVFMGSARKVRRLRTVYDSSSVVVCTRPGPVHLGYGGGLIAAGLLVLMTYSVVVAATLQSTVPLLLSWSIVGLWLLASIWFSETSAAWRKLALSACIPMGYFVIAGALIVGGAGVIIRRLARI